MGSSEKTTDMRPLTDPAVLAKRAGWMILLRWVAAACVVLGTFVCSRVLAIEVQADELYGIAVLLALYNGAMLALLRRAEKGGQKVSGRLVKLLVDFQISADLLILTVLALRILVSQKQLHIKKH